MCSRDDDPTQHQEQEEGQPWQGPTLEEWLDRMSVRGDPEQPQTLYPIPWPWITPPPR